MSKVLSVYRSLAPQFALGWLRDDVFMVHGIAQASPGEDVVPSDGRGGPHWPCEVCDAHGYSEALFHGQVEAALLNGPVSDRDRSAPRCLVTGNLCGTDTWMVGRECQCTACQEWIRAGH